MFVYISGICVLSGNHLDTSQVIIDLERYCIGIANSIWFCSIIFLIRKDLTTNLCTSIGKHTLAIYGFQEIFFILISASIERFGVRIPHNYITPFILTSLIIGLSELLILICNKTKTGRFLFLGS